MDWPNLSIGICPLCCVGKLEEGKYGFGCSKNNLVGHMRCGFFITKSKHTVLKRHLKEQARKLDEL